MIVLFSDSDFQSAKSRDLLPMECVHCKQTFYLLKHEIHSMLSESNSRRGNTGNFCSHKCQQAHQAPLHVNVTCDHCGKSFTARPSRLTKLKHHFCSSSCSAKFSNAHKTTGYRRSKMEKYIEDQLNTLYTGLFIRYNSSEAIGMELDIFIPSTMVAFEINGVFHYKPIYGAKKFERIKQIDAEKVVLCANAGISLHVLDISHIIKFDPSLAAPLLTQISEVIGVTGGPRSH